MINFQIICKFILFYSIILNLISILKRINIEISVIIPTFNRGKLIANSIKSVLNQTIKNLEIIIVDDGSTDNTKEVIDKFQDRRIKYIKLDKNQGASNARNIGIKAAKGRYISFQDSDDIFYPNKLEIQLNNIINKKTDLDFCKINVLYNSTYNYLVPSSIREKRFESGDFFTELISNGNFISTQSILIKKSFMKKFLFDPNMPRLQDYDVILRMIPKVKISYTKEVLVDLHIQNDSLTLSPVKLKNAIYLLLKKEYNFNDKQKKDFSNYLNFLLSNILI